MNGQRWRKAGLAMALSVALAAPLEAAPPAREGYPGNVQLASEFYNAELGEFVVTTSVEERKKLDEGLTPGWERTNFSFFVVDGPADIGPVGAGNPTAVPVCRYFIPPASHFLSALADECKAVGANIAGAVLESEAVFHAWLPDADGQCPQSPTGSGHALAPVYRMWDSVQGTAHRVTTIKEMRDAMIANGWITEGYGADGVAMCVPLLSGYY